MVYKVAFWAGFGVLTRLWQLGLQGRWPINVKKPLQGLHFYPAYAAVGGAFGYWLQSVEQKQVAVLEERKQAILAKRARRAARESEAVATA